jgi:hypothetical protein
MGLATCWAIFGGHWAFFSQNIWSHCLERTSRAHQQKMTDIKVTKKVGPKIRVLRKKMEKKKM